MNVELDADFEEEAAENIMDSVEAGLIGQQGNLVFEAIQQSKEALEDFADEYDINPIWESLSGPEVERSDRQITVRWSFDHPAAGYFEFGTPDNYEIDGDPVLSFVWEDPPAWVKDEFDREADGWRVFFSQVDSGDGIDETRFTRWGLRWLRFQLEGR